MEKIEVIQVLKQAGFTIIEMMVVLIIGIILVTMTAPNMISMIQNNTMVSLHNDLLSDLALTRNTAVTRGNSATLCASNNVGTQCQSNSNVWTYGWLVFNDADNDAVVDGNETIIVVRNQMPNQLQILASSGRISFNFEGSAFGFAGEFAFCDDRGDTDKKGLIVSNSGRSRVAKANELTLSCP